MDDLESVLRGDPGARDRWVAEWWPRVYRMALAVTGREADAEDLAQETMMAGLAALPRFRGEARPSTWLYAILIRKHRSQMRRPTATPPRPAAGREPDLDAALDLLADLPPGQKIAAAMFYVDDLSVREIAQALGIPGPTVRWRLFRARRKLRRALEGSRPRPLCKELL